MIMATDQPGPSRFKDIKARFESPTPTLNNHHSESTVEKTKRLFEKTKNPINASNRFKPALKPKPKYLSQQRIDPQPPPVPKHASFNRSIVSPVFKNKFNFSGSNNTATSDGSSLCPMSSTLSSPENIRDSHMSDDVLPPTPTATDTPADSSSSEDSSPEFDEDDFYDQERKASMNNESCKVETLHTSIINQMKKEGLFKQLEAIKENQNCNGVHENEKNINDENANDVENGVVMREAPDVPLHGVVDKYFDAEESEKERLIMMERLAGEIGMKEEYFVKILTLMIRTYPEYLGTCKIKGSKYGTQFRDTVSAIVCELEPVLKIHENLLNEFAQICLSWDSRNPNLANVLYRNVDFLQICVSFLTKKRKLCQDFKLTTDADAEFAHATHQFEVQVMNNPDVHGNSSFEHMVYKPIENTVRNSGVCFYQQLDMIHQNVVRYKLFMERYQKLLDPSSVNEIALTKQVLEKLDKILNSINARLEEPQALAFLLKNYEKFQNRNFNILMPGRHLIREGLVLRQGRRGLLERKLVLFSDALLICHMDYSEFWKIDLRTSDIIVEDGVERDKWFLVYGTNKSTAIQCSSKGERDSWVQTIVQAQNEFRALRRRNEPREIKAPAFSALWVADDEATTCMMADCVRKFNILQRRHHCRKCGFVICKPCSAFALLPNDSYSASRVCPACFYEIKDLLHSEKMEWSSNVAEVTEKRVRFTNGREKAIKELFIPPRTGKKIRGDDYSDKSKYLADSTVFTKNGTRYARLTTDFNLYFFAARYDPQPAEHYYVQGYSYTATENSKDDRVSFKLIQQTGPKNSVIEFNVNDKFYSLWEDALKQLK